MKSLKKGQDYEVRYRVRGEARSLKLWRLKHLDLRSWRRPEVDDVTVGARLAQSTNDLIDRLKAGECEACGDRSGPFEMHHLRRLKDLRSEPLTIWKRSSRRRKTIVLCRACHLAVHSNRLNTHMETLALQISILKISCDDTERYASGGDAGWPGPRRRARFTSTRSAVRRRRPSGRRNADRYDDPGHQTPFMPTDLPHDTPYTGNET